MADNYYSKRTKQYQKKQTKQEKKKPKDYESRWQSTIDTQLDKILKREPFSYDFNADPVYQMYKDQYVNQGRQAMENTVGNVSALTGGYGNSYAATAGSQAYQEYLKGLNSVIPELQQNALNKYQMETENLYNQYNALGQQEDREYSQYADNWNRWYNMLGYYADQFNTGAKRDQGDYQFDTDMAFQRERAAVEDQHWAAEFALKQAAMAGGGGGGEAPVSGGTAGGGGGGGRSGRSSGGSSGGTSGGTSGVGGIIASLSGGANNPGIASKVLQPQYDDRGFRLNNLLK